MKNKPSSGIRSVRRKPREDWPASFHVLWDFSSENIYLAADGGTPEDYTSDEDSFGEADFAEIDESCTVLAADQLQNYGGLWTTKWPKPFYIGAMGRL